MEQLKVHLFDAKVPKEIAQARNALVKKAETYYSSEALNPRPKRGRPPKQVAKIEIETQVTSDIYTQVPPPAPAFSTFLISRQPPRSLFPKNLTPKRNF